MGHDPYYWGRPAGSAPYKISDITARDAFTVYLEALRKYPDVVIKDRLDGTDILWDVVQPPDSFNARSFSFVSPFPENTLPLDTSRLDRLDDGSYIKTAVPAKAYYSAANTPINSAADMLLWRTGAYLITFLALLLFWNKNRMGRLWWAAVPMLGNIAGLCSGALSPELPVRLFRSGERDGAALYHRRGEAELGRRTANRTRKRTFGCRAGKGGRTWIKLPF